MSVIGDIIGIPEEDRPQIFDTLDRILDINSPESSLSEQDQLELFANIFSYALELTDEKRRNPVDNIWSTLTSAVITDEPANSYPYLPTSSRSFSSYSPLRAVTRPRTRWLPDCRRLSLTPGRSSGTAPTLRSDPARWKRCCAGRRPSPFGPRTAKVDLEIDGVAIPKGGRVVSMLRSANRDDEVFGDPFTFDIGRTDNQHVTFGGGGPHHCLGATLARAEIRAVLDELLCRADDITLGPPKVTFPNLTNNMSIYDELAISLTPR
jgi:cytochrome P450